MAAIKPPKPVKLFVAMLSADRDLMRRALQLLTRILGPVENTSAYWPFEHTDYYLDELGEGVERQFAAFAQTLYPDRLADIKRQTNELERRIAEDLGLPAGGRPVNLDPGYLTLSKVVLATTKDYNHRIYLQSGIYAEVTLTFKAGHWVPWPWTYPDYASGAYEPFFQALRESLKAHLAGQCPLNRGDQAGEPRPERRGPEPERSGADPDQRGSEADRSDAESDPRDSRADRSGSESDRPGEAGDRPPAGQNERS